MKIGAATETYTADVTRRRSGKMLKFIGGTIGVIFIIGLLVVIGLLALIF